MPPPPVASCLAALGFPSAAWQGPVSVRIHSAIHRARYDGADVAIKHCFDPGTRAPNPWAARHEFEALSRVTASTGRVPVELVPQPFVLCAAEGSYAMRYVQGASATSLVLSSSHDAMSLGALAGRWLLRFHEAHALGIRRSDFETKLPVVAEMQAARRHDPLVARVARVLLRTAAAAAAVPMPASWIHGDMKSDNLLVEADRVVGLDVHIVDENSVAYDLAPFLNHLMLLARSLGGYRHRSNLGAMADAFLAAYSPRAGEWRLPILWLRAYLLVQPLVSMHASWPRRVATLPRRGELARVIRTLEGE